MERVQIKLKSDVARKNYVVEQGIPVLPMDRKDVDKLRLVDEAGNIAPASIEHDGRDENDKTVWVRISAPIDINAGEEKHFALELRDDVPPVSDKLDIRDTSGKTRIISKNYTLEVSNPGNIRLSTANGDLIDGPINFQLWPDARSIVGAGAGTCRLAHFIPDSWSLEEQTNSRCLVVLKGKVPKFAAYTSDPENFDPNAQFDCELELICHASSPVIRFRWSIENHTVWQAYLERYTLLFPLAKNAETVDGEESDDEKFLRYVQVRTPGGTLGMTANFVEALGAGAGINVERRKNLGKLPVEKIQEYAGDGTFEPHKFLKSNKDEGSGLDIVQGGVNPPFDGHMAAENPEVHRLFYVGMGRSFDGALFVNCTKEEIQTEMSPIYFELEPNYYSKTGTLPEQGDPVYFGEYKDKVFAAAEWLLNKQWKGTLWWGEWWREFDVYRGQGIESTANGNNPLGPLYHYWRTGDVRFVECAKRSLEFEYDIQLSKRKGGLGPFFQSRRFLIDKMEWVHMRYQRIEGPIKAAHFLGNRRLRNKLIEAMSTYARNLVCPNGAPGYGEGGPNGKRIPAGGDCTNFGEVLAILYRETGNQEFLEMGKKMANWTIRTMKKWDWDAYVGNSYGWHFMMRGMLQTAKLTNNKRFWDWYVDMAHKNMTYPMEEIQFVYWMDWLIVEAERKTGEKWMLDVLKKNTAQLLKKEQKGGGIRNDCKYPWSKWPSKWEYIYDTKGLVSYVPVMAARRKALGME